MKSLELFLMVEVFKNDIYFVNIKVKYERKTKTSYLLRINWDLNKFLVYCNTDNPRRKFKQCMNLKKRYMTKHFITLRCKKIGLYHLPFSNLICYCN